MVSVRRIGNPEGEEEGDHGSRALSLWEILGVVNHLDHNAARLRWYKSSIFTVKLMSMLNVTYAIVGVSLLFLTICPALGLNLTAFQTSRFFETGVLLTVFASLALCVDVLALAGLSKWRRRLLIPWLTFYAFTYSIVFTATVCGIYHYGIQWNLMFFLFICIWLYKWRHLKIQYNLMGIYPEMPFEARLQVATIDQLAEGILAVAGVQGILAETKVEPPPKYEDLEQPPVYEECITNGTDSAGTSITGPPSSSESVDAALSSEYSTNSKDNLANETAERKNIA